jgi:hypothetical protein
VDAHRVPRLEARDLAQLTALDFLDGRAHGKWAQRAAAW